MTVVAASVLRFWGIGFGLPHWWARPDEESMIIPAVRMAGGALNPHWFHWPSLYMYVLAGPYALYIAYQRARGAAIPAELSDFYFAHPGTFQLIDRGLSAALGVLSVYVVYRLGRLASTPRAGLIGAFFLALAPLHVRDSHFGTADVAAAFIVLVAAWAIVRWYTAPSRARLVIAGACCGLAASTKYNAVLILVPAGIAIVLAAIERRERRRALTGDLLVVAGVAALAFVIGTPYALLDHSAFLAGVRDVGQHLSAGHGVDLGAGWSYHPRVTLRYGLGLPLLATAVVGMVWMAIEKPRIAALLLSFPLVYFAAAGSTHLVFFRYAIPLIPFLCLAAAYAIGRLPPAGSWIIAALVMAPAAVDVVRMDRLLARTDNRVLAAAWIEERFPGGASVYQSGAIYGHLQFRDAARFNEIPVAARPDLIVVQASPLFYSADAPQVQATADAQYTRVAEFRAHDPAQAAGNVYDPLDAFYLPLRGFAGVARPGPNITVYRRR